MARPVLVLHAHPYPDRSYAGRALVEAVRGMDDVAVRSLYSLYPDFWIDVAAEQAALIDARVVVWQSPIFWYSVPALLSLWFEKVLARGWAYGVGGHALRGKTCLWVTTTGAEHTAYRPGQMHGFPFDTFVPHIEQTARFCGMHWEPPLVVHGSSHIDGETLAGVAGGYRRRLEELAARTAAASVSTAAGSTSAADAGERP